MSRFIRVGVGLLCATFAFWTALTILGNSFFGSMDNRKIMAVGTPERQYFYSHIGWMLALSFAAMPVIGAIGYWRAKALIRPRMLPLGKVVAGFGLVIFVLTLAYLPFLFLALGTPASNSQKVISIPPNPPG